MWSDELPAELRGRIVVRHRSGVRLQKTEELNVFHNFPDGISLAQTRTSESRSPGQPEQLVRKEVTNKKCVFLNNIQLI